MTGDEAAMGGFIKAGWSGGARQRGTEVQERGEQQLVDGGMARERARKLAERDETRRA